MNQFSPLAAKAMSAAIAGRHAAIHQAVSPLPGSVPHDHFKSLNIPADCDGLTLLLALQRMVGNVGETEWVKEFAQGRIVNLAQEPVTASICVRAGQRFQHLFPNVAEPAVNGAVQILHEDEALIVVNKPAPLPMHAGGRFYRNTLQYILNAAYHPQTPHPVHRLDANTTGLVLVARTPEFASELQTQFRDGQVEKTYLVRVAGQPPAPFFECAAAISSNSGERGSRTVDAASGQFARTEFRVLQRQTDGTVLLAARPLTGRTHQIRVHLWHLGFPVCGDSLYLAGKEIGQTPTLAVNDPPLCLHAGRVKFVHPVSREPVEFTAPAPSWADSFSITDLCKTW